MYFQNSLEEAANPACKEIDLMQTDIQNLLNISKNSCNFY